MYKWVEIILQTKDKYTFPLVIFLNNNENECEIKELEIEGIQKELKRINGGKGIVHIGSTKTENNLKDSFFGIVNEINDSNFEKK